MKWSNEEFLSLLEEFKYLYNERIIRDNTGGMKSHHMFPAWFVVKKLKPKVLIESGVWKGLGTWFFEKASPETRIISIDPEPKFRVYKSEKVHYQTEDFLETDWGFLNPKETLVFFDDHQNCIPRIKRCRELGFKKVIIEDNYPPQQGDCYSPKKILSNENFVIDVNGYKTWYQKSDIDYEFLKDNIDIYQEMPPIFKSDVTRWGDPWDDKYPTPDPLLEMTPENMEKYKEFFDERFDYTWICYMELK